MEMVEWVIGLCVWLFLLGCVIAIKYSVDLHERQVSNLAYEVREMLEAVPAQKMHGIYRKLNDGEWSEAELGKRPEWWDKMIFNKNQSWIDFLFCRKKIFSFEVIGEILTYIPYAYFKKNGRI